MATNSQKPKIVGEGLTDDDVLLIPAYSEVLPRDVQLASNFSRNITLKTPVISAAMDTVTGSAMAIAMKINAMAGVISPSICSRMIDSCSQRKTAKDEGEQVRCCIASTRSR